MFCVLMLVQKLYKILIHNDWSLGLALSLEMCACKKIGKIILKIINKDRI